jgi:Protein of unknown function (DUF4236)
MSFRFRRTLSLLPGIRLNLGKSGASVSVGPKGAKITAGPKGIRATAGVPGTGMFFSQQIATTVADPRQEAEQPALNLPPEVEEVIRERPPHWEFLLLQRALRYAFDDINAMAAIGASHGTDAITFQQWISEILDEFQDLVSDLEAVQTKIAEALGPAGQPGDPDRLVIAVDQFISVVRSAITCEQRAAVLARHPLYGDLAAPLRDVAQPFVDYFKDFLQKLDDQLPNVDITHRLDLQFTVKRPVSLASFGVAQNAFVQRFFDSNYNLKTGDVVAERFQIARGEQQVGEFSRAAIADNLRNNIFRQDDWYWSEDAKNWQPLSALVL